MSSSGSNNDGVAGSRYPMSSAGSDIHPVAAMQTVYYYMLPKVEHAANTCVGLRWTMRVCLHGGNTVGHP